MNCAKKMILAVAILNASLASTVVMASDSTTSLISAAAAMQSNEDMPSLAPLLDKVIPAVVNISVQGKKSLNNDMANNIPEQFRFFFPDMPKEREFQALGSGVVINVEKGYIITNYHVVDGASEIKITFQDGRVIKATKVGEDEQTDFALLKLETIPKNLTALKFADSDKLRVGDFAIAIGNPFGLGQTVTSGIISALGRSGLNIENYENFIQTDAAINSGNSGGALINLRGELIGINTAILGKSGGNIGIGFAIPSNMANNIAQQIMKHGSVKRGMLGIMGTEVTDELAKNFEYENTNGAFVNEVMKGSAAEKAGIRSGDILTSINGVPIKNFGQLRAKIATYGAGSKVKLGVFRDGENIEVEVTLASNNGTEAAVDAISSSVLKGAKLANDPKGNGVLVTEVQKGSPAEELNLAKGDIIAEVNRKPTKSVTELEKILSKKSGFIALKIIRGNAIIYVTRNY